jgi:hypothetical protein
LNVIGSQDGGGEITIGSEEVLNKLPGCDSRKTRVSVLQSAEVHGTDSIDKLLLEGGINVVVELPEAKVLLVSAEERLDLGGGGSGGDDGNGSGIVWGDKDHC